MYLKHSNCLLSGSGLAGLDFLKTPVSPFLTGVFSEHGKTGALETTNYDFQHRISLFLGATKAYMCKNENEPKSGKSSAEYARLSQFLQKDWEAQEWAQNIVTFLDRIIKPPETFARRDFWILSNVMYRNPKVAFRLFRRCSPSYWCASICWQWIKSRSAKFQNILAEKPQTSIVVKAVCRHNLNAAE